MAVIWFNTAPALSGGPSVWVYKTANELRRRGHKVIFDDPKKSDVAVCVISVGKTIRKIDRSKTKIILRVDGVFNAEYNKLFNRPVRPDMVALHKDLEINIPRVDFVVFQSYFSKERINEEIVTRQDNNWAVINNGVDVNLFKPAPKNDKTITLFHIGNIRNGYIMESLIGVYSELLKRGHKIKLTIAGGMDAECSKIYNQHKGDKNISYLGSVPNTAAAKLFSLGDIYLGPRMGSSNDNVISEALACGLPVIVPQWSGNAELITDGSEGIIVDSGGHWNYGPDYDSKLADGVERILPNLDDFKTRARKHAVANLTVWAMTDKYLKAMGL